MRLGALVSGPRSLRGKQPSPGKRAQAGFPSWGCPPLLFVASSGAKSYLVEAGEQSSGSHTPDLYPPVGMLAVAAQELG